jgi:hypothetical protein
MTRLLLLLALLLPLPVLADAPPLTPYVAEYEVSRNDMFLGASRRTLSLHSGQRVDLTAQTRPQGLVSWFVSDEVHEHSKVLLDNGQVLPQRYRYNKTGKRPEQFEVRYDYQQQILSHSLLDETPALNGTDQDLLSFQLAMMLALQQGQREMTFRIADKNRIEEYRLRQVGEKTFNTRMGRLQTVVLEYHDTERDRIYTFWCAKELGYLPYQTRRVDDSGNIIQLRLRRYNDQAANLREPLD